MKMKERSFLIKMVLVVFGFALCLAKWCGILPDASISDIWTSIAFAYGVGLGTIDLNIVRDSWKGC